ncbi:MAG: coenzyme F390 synthetase, partial [Methanobacterium sp.]
METYFNPEIETMPRDELDALVDARIKYTVNYAFKNSPFYRKWFKENNIKVSDIKSHEDLRELPIINGQTIREKQPPETEEF